MRHRRRDRRARHAARRVMASMAAAMVDRRLRRRGRQRKSTSRACARRSPRPLPRAARPPVTPGVAPGKRALADSRSRTRRSRSWLATCGHRMLRRSTTAGRRGACRSVEELATGPRFACASRSVHRVRCGARQLSDVLETRDVTPAAASAAASSSWPPARELLLCHVTGQRHWDLPKGGIHDRRDARARPRCARRWRRPACASPPAALVDLGRHVYTGEEGPAPLRGCLSDRLDTRRAALPEHLHRSHLGPIAPGDGWLRLVRLRPHRAASARPSWRRC